MSAPTHDREGITVAARPDGLMAYVTRHDTTHITIHDSGLAATVADLARRGDFLILDPGLYAAWEKQLRPVLRPGRYLVAEPGEQGKSPAQALRIIDRLHEAGVDRRTTLTAVGGGVVCDLTGLVAALYFRGVRAAYVPTTLLAMIDASIGGKTGVNHPRQKNLLGTFSHPAEVHIRLDALHTLPTGHVTSAFGEAVKIALVDDPTLFELLADPRAGDVAWMRSIVEICVRRKLQLLGANCFERDLERALNLGHTVAHPLEDITAFRIPHGTAVAIGIAVACHISHARGLLPTADLERILHVLHRLGLPVMDPDVDPGLLQERVQHLLLQRGGRSLHYVLPVTIGKIAFTDTITPAELRDAVTDLRRRQEEGA
ncbi:3-dehydroquinate synthase family protein [Streptomyces sp. NPDC048330]|uniref:3-dehydroquinate synthase family protein n=1 Tax=Streptomyces sp. NPDC048330 TaxID=3365533 RepID=UPI00371D2D39